MAPGRFAAWFPTSWAKGNFSVCKTFFIALSFTVAALGADSAFADPSSDMKACATISDASKRLACFDVLAEKITLDGAAGTEKNKPGWSVASTVSPITDQNEVFLQRRSQNSVETDVFGVVHPVFLAQCLSGKTSVAVNWGFIVGGGTIPVTYRIDEGEPKTVAIKVSDDFRSIASWDSDRAVAVLKALIGKKTFAVQVTALSQGPMRAVFDMAGLDKAIAPLRKACNW